MCIGGICSERVSRRDDSHEDPRTRFDRVTGPLREPFSGLARALTARLDGVEGPASIRRLLDEDPCLGDGMLAALGQVSDWEATDAAQELADTFCEAAARHGMTREPESIRDGILDDLQDFVFDSITASGAHEVEARVGEYCDQLDRIGRDRAAARVPIDVTLDLRQRALENSASPAAVREAFVNSLTSLGMDSARAARWEGIAARGGIGDVERRLMTDELARGAPARAAEDRRLFGSLTEEAHRNPSLFFELFSPAVRQAASQCGVSVSSRGEPLNDTFASRAFADALSADRARVEENELLTRVALYAVSATTLIAGPLVAAGTAIALSVGVGAGGHVISSTAANLTGRLQRIDMADRGETIGVSPQGLAASLRLERGVSWGAGFLAVFAGAGPGGVATGALVNEVVTYVADRVVDRAVDVGDAPPPPFGTMNQQPFGHRM